MVPVSAAQGRAHSCRRVGTTRWTRAVRTSVPQRNALRPPPAKSFFTCFCKQKNTLNIQDSNIFNAWSGHKSNWRDSLSSFYFSHDTDFTKCARDWVVYLKNVHSAQTSMKRLIGYGCVITRLILINFGCFDWITNIILTHRMIYFYLSENISICFHSI